MIIKLKNGIVINTDNIAYIGSIDYPNNKDKKNKAFINFTSPETLYTEETVDELFLILSQNIGACSYDNSKVK